MNQFQSLNDKIDNIMRNQLTLIQKQEENSESIQEIKNKLSYYTGAFRGVLMISGLVIGVFGYVATNYQIAKDENDKQLFNSVYAIDNRVTKLEVLKNEKFPRVDN